MKKVMYAALLLQVLIFGSCTKTSDNDLNAQDRNFALQTVQGNNAEMGAAMLALTKASNAQVKSFAQFMITEHSMAQTDLKTLNSSLGIIVQDSTDSAHIAIKTQLSALSGRAFDSVYIYTQVADHDMTISNFNNEISFGNNKDLLAYANTYLPHIQMHRQSADSISKAFFKR